MKSNDQLRFKVSAVRTLSSPYAAKEKSTLIKDDANYVTLYYLLVNMRDLPANIPMEVNPRKPRMTTNVAVAIQNAVTDPDRDFYYNNRGIVISAKNVIFDPSNSEICIDIGDTSNEEDLLTYGILDGGHTYTAILEKRDNIPEDVDQYVRIEVITNVPNIAKLSDARNTSISVSDIALYNLDDKFDDIKNAVQGETWGNEVAYKDNDRQRINISNLLRLMYAFDLINFPDDRNAPVQSYSGKAQVFKRFKQVYDNKGGKYNNDLAFYKALIVQIPTLVRLYDTIEREIGEKYNQYKKNSGFKNPHFGNVAGVEKGKSTSFKTFFLQHDIDYNTSSGYIYPIFGAFRSLLQWDSQKKLLKWIFDPLELWEDGTGVSLVQNVFESSNNPQLAGKDKQLWLSSYRIVETQKLRKLLQGK